jgi:hypothetical protein
VATVGVVHEAAPPLPPASWPAPAVHDGAHRRAHQLGQGALVLTGLGAGLLAARAASLATPPCPWLTLTGVPCPGCGITRLAAALAEGRIGFALEVDPAGVAFLVVLALLAVVHLATVVVRRRPPPPWMANRALPLAVGALVLVHWATTLVTGGMTAT